MATICYLLIYWYLFWRVLHTIFMVCNTTPQSMCIVHLDHTLSIFLWLEKFLKKYTNDQCSSITKGSIYHMKHMYKQSFSMGVDWPEIKHLNLVCCTFAHTAFLLCGQFNQFHTALCLTFSLRIISSLLKSCVKSLTPGGYTMTGIPLLAGLLDLLDILSLLYVKLHCE